MANRLKQLGFKDYPHYLKSPQWAAIRRLVLARDKGLCTHCKDTASQVHHLTYARIGKEDMVDLASVCDACHAGIHGKHAKATPYKREKKSKAQRRVDCKAGYKPPKTPRTHRQLPKGPGAVALEEKYKLQRAARKAARAG